MSPSLRGRGLKFFVFSLFVLVERVALFTRAWIEIQNRTTKEHEYAVALFTRAWIEITHSPLSFRFP